MGICRGSQLVNLYRGGKMTPYTWNQHDVVQNYKLPPKKTGGIIRGLTKFGGFKGCSLHHEGITKTGEGIDVVATLDGIVKASESKNGARGSSHSCSIPPRIQG